MIFSSGMTPQQFLALQAQQDDLRQLAMARDGVISDQIQQFRSLEERLHEVGQRIDEPTPD